MRCTADGHVIKLALVNGVSICKLVFVSDIDIFITCFNFQTSLFIK